MSNELPNLMMEFVKKLNCGITAEIITHFCYAQNVLPMILSGNSDVFLNKLIIIIYIIFNLLINIQYLSKYYFQQAKFNNRLNEQKNADFFLYLAIICTRWINHRGDAGHILEERTCSPG